jgi:short-subunit dehydrogenase
VSKSAVKSLAESLAHSLLPTKVSVHLLVPGYTYTKLTNGGGDPNPATVPKAAWTTEQVAQYLFSKINVDGPSFYIVRPAIHLL